jgi:hypothetical protein
MDPMEADPGNSGARTESAPGAGDGGGAGEVGGVAEQPEDDGGGVRAEAVEEVHRLTLRFDPSNQISSSPQTLAEWGNVAVSCKHDGTQSQGILAV